MLAPLAIVLAGGAPSAQADNYFNPRFLSDDPSAVADLSGFEKGLDAPPGTYRVDIYLNDGYMATRDVLFQPDADGKALEPCFTRSQLSAMGVDLLAVPGMAALTGDACVPFTRMIKHATSQFDVGRQRLSVSIPQAFMESQARGYIAPALWDNGITAGLINYNFTGSRVSTTYGHVRHYAYLNLQNGVNLGAWRLRDNTTWNYSSGNQSGSGENHWQHVNTWVERDIIPLRSRLTFGDGYTAGDIFDGLNFRGAQIASDDNMLPESQRGFAPVIHGIARGTARVSIKQNGYEIYQTTVPPGAFTINDLYAAGSSGDFQVTITEADGSTQTFTVPYSSVPLLQREGRMKYALAAGQFRSGNDQQSTPTFGQGTLLWGLPDGWTVYGGALLSNDYRAFNIGSGKNLGELGAVSVDITQSNSTLPDKSQHQGQSLRFLYNKSLNAWGTNLQIVGYRYSTQGFFTLADTTWKHMDGYSVLDEDGILRVTPKYTDYYNLHYSKRGRLQATVTQQIGRTSTLYLTGSHQTYWGTGRTDEQLQVGYNSAVQDITWSLNYSLTKNAWQQGRDQMLAFNINIPFSHWLRSDSQSTFRNSNASFSVSNDLRGRTTSLAGVNGTLLENNNLNYSVQTGYAGGGMGTSGGTGNMALNYRGAYGNANVGYSHSNGNNQLYYGLTGGVLLHENGVTLSQPMSDTMVLIKAPGADNVAVENQTGVRTDWRGYAVLPYAIDYRENRIALDTGSLANNVELDDPVVSVVPTHGAVVRADFKPHIGFKVLMTLLHNGKPVPFGSIASYGDGQSGSIVADAGVVYLTGLAPMGTVNVKWGNGADERCTAAYHLSPVNRQQALSYATVNCR